MPNQDLRFGPVKPEGIERDVNKLLALAEDIRDVAEEARRKGIRVFETDGHRKFERGYKELRLYHRKLQIALERVT
jgi:hypothetical protein